MPSSTLFLVSCVSKKADEPAAARDLYLSPLFRLARQYVERQEAEWFILSAEHGLLDPNRVVAPYDRTLNRMAAPERRAWARAVAGELRALGRRWETVVVLAGHRYREYLMEDLRDLADRVETPLAPFRIGEQLQWLKQGGRP